MTTATETGAPVDLAVSPAAGARVLASERLLLRAAHPVTFDVVDRLLGGRAARRVPGVGVLVADPVLVRQVLSDTTFRKDGPGSSGALWSGVLGYRTLIGMEGDAHRNLRRALTSLFTPQAARAVCDRVLAAPLERVRADLVAGKPVDLVAVTRTAATSVIASLVGMLPADASAEQVEEVSSQLLRASDEVLGMVRLRTRRLSAGQVARVAQLFAPMAAAATAAYDAAGADGSDSVLSRLPALGISREQAPALAAVLLLTGTETVTSAAPRTLAMLFDSELAAPLARAGGTAGDAALTAVVTEALRMATPSPAMLRRATRDLDLGSSGVRVRRGDRVLLGTWWATRLPGGFAPERGGPATARHLWFGAGQHFCLGASLAMTEVEAMSRAVLAAEREVGPVRIVHRSASRRVLVPSYSRLVLQADKRAPGDARRPSNDTEQ